MNRRKRFPPEKNSFPIAGMKDSFKNIFPLDGKTGSTSRNRGKMNEKCSVLKKGFHQ